MRSYFQPPVKLGPKTAALVGQISSIDHIEVMSEIEALLLESKLIKKFLPPYNIASRDDKSPYYIHIMAEKFPKPIVNHEPNKAIAGPFLSGFLAKSILRQFRRIAPFCTAQRKVSRPCLYFHLGLCHPCPNNPGTDTSKYRQNMTRLKRLIKGQFVQVQRQLKSQMRMASQNQDYETAAAARDYLRSLEILLLQPISPDEYLVNPNLVADKQRLALDALKEALHTGSLTRIEMYDVANLAGTAATAAMTVAIEGEINSRNFRHFTIKTKNTPDDVAMLGEVLVRRLKRADWPQPDLIVLDGGKSQLSIADRIGSYPIIALAKKEEIITIPTHPGYREIKLDRDNPGLQLLMRLRDEAHRFSRRLHHKHRAILK